MPAPGSALGERMLSGQGPAFAAVLTDVLENLAQAVVIRDRRGRFVYINRAAARTLGLTSGEELLGQPLSAVLSRFIIRDDRGRPMTAEALPSVMLLKTGVVPEPLLLQVTDPGRGDVRWLRLRSDPLRDERHEVIAAVTVIDDVTAVRAGEVHTRVLAASGRQLSASLDYEQTLQNVASVALPDLADWCVVELVDGATRERVVVAHFDESLQPLVAQLRALEPPEPGPDSLLHRVLVSGESVLDRDISDERLQQVAVSADQLELYRRLDVRSAMVVPMRVASRIVGAISLVGSRSRARFTAEDLGVAEQLARRAAVAVENARLHTVLAGVADTLQDSLLPSPVPDVPGWEIGALYRPAPGATRIDVGGDFYEVFDTAGDAFATIGDVTGHGVRAATITSLLRHGARFASHLEPEPVAIIRRLDEELRRRPDGTMATALCAALHDHSVLLCSAGHPPALLTDLAGHTTEAPRPGPLLGAFTDAVWHQERVPVADGQTVLLYTDGVTETARGGERFGTERLRRFLSAHAGSDPQPLLDLLAEELVRFGGGPATDDVAALALRPRAR